MATEKPEYQHGISLFNQGKFFDAHEVLEDVWRISPNPEKKIWQGMVQAAVALHHHSTGNHLGMRSVLLRAIKNMGEHPPHFHGIEVARFRAALSKWLEEFDQGKTTAVPRIELTHGSRE